MVGASAADDSVELNVANGFIVITDTGYKQVTDQTDLNMNNLTSHTGGYVLTGSSVKKHLAAEEAPAVQIVGGSADAPIKITLDGVEIIRDQEDTSPSPGSVERTPTPDVGAIVVGHSLVSSNSSPIYYSGHAAITLKEGTENTLRSCGYFAGLMMRSKSVNESCSVVIDGEGTLNAFGGNAMVDDSGYYLLSGGAGIGTAYLPSSLDPDLGINTLEIKSGTINALGSNSSAGIGGGGGDIGLRTITISGGTITATPGHRAAGIGSGSGYYHATYPNPCSSIGPCDIFISGATVTAYGRSSVPGIGSGSYTQFPHTITIANSNVTAQGIGSGDSSVGTSAILIENSAVVIINSGISTGIGAGSGAKGECTIDITNGSVITATGSSGPGIGKSMKDGTCTINIQDAEVQATGSYCSAGIGTGIRSEGTCNITISNSKVVATGGEGQNSLKGAAGIGLGTGSTATCGIIIEGGTVTAIGGIGAAGIGRGSDPTAACPVPTLAINKDAVVRAYAIDDSVSTSIQAIDSSITTVTPSGQNGPTRILMGHFESTQAADKAIRLVGTAHQDRLIPPVEYQSFATTIAADTWKVGVDGKYYSGGTTQGSPGTNPPHLFDTATSEITNVWSLKPAAPELAYHNVTFVLGENGKQIEGDTVPLVQEVDDGFSAAVPAVTANSDYTFTGWRVDTTTIVKPEDMLIIENTIFTAIYSSTIDDTPSKGETDLPLTPDKGGNTTVIIPDGNITDAIHVAKQHAGQNGISITVNIPLTQTTNSLSVILSEASLNKLIAEGTKMLYISSGLISYAFNLDALIEIQKSVTNNLSIVGTTLDDGNLSQDAQAAIGNRPVFNISTQSSGKAITDFGKGTASVWMPYSLPQNETAVNLQAVYVDKNGKTQWIPRSRYDTDAKALMFTSSHFSTYGVAYRTDVPKFTDIANHWAKTDIELVAIRRMLSGTDETVFSPDTAMTRGMFVTALGRLSGIDSAMFKNTRFTDVKGDAYYAPYVAWATENHITSGTTATTFAPEQAITRQEMAVLIENYSNATKYNISKTHAAHPFADQANIESWAEEAIKSMQMAGVIIGKNGNYFDPAGVATRAETSAILHRYVS